MRFKQPASFTTFCALPHILALVVAAITANTVHAQATDPRFRFENAPSWYDLGVDPAFPYLDSRRQADAALGLDFDNDGDLDLIRSQWGRLDFARNDGGALTTYCRYHPDSFGYAYLLSEVGVGDFDGDQLVDVATSGVSRSLPWPLVTQILTNDGAGGFLPQPTTTLPWQYLSSEYPGLQVADVDGDGLADRVFHPRWGREMYVLPSNGGPGALYALPFNAYELRLGDLSGDGLPDVVVRLIDVGWPSPPHGLLHVRINDGFGGFGGTIANFGSLYQPSGLALGDFDRDGDVDAVTTETEAATYIPRYTDLVFFPGDGRGNLGTPIRSHLADASWPISDCQFGLLDGDSEPDLALCTSYAASGPLAGIVAIARGLGGGQFVLSSATSTNARYLVIDDLTGTGQPKLLTAEASVLPVDVEGRIGGAMVGRVRSLSRFTDDTGVTFALPDYDGDGRADVLTYSNPQGLLNCYFSDGEGGFSLPLEMDVGPIFLDQGLLDAVELDGDGLPDAALIGTLNPFQGRPEVYTVLNVGGTGGSQPIMSPLSTCQVAFGGKAYGDLDGDGAVELLRSDYSSYSDRTGTYGHGRGDGSFDVSCFQFPDHTGTKELQLFDMNGDGNLDLAFVGRDQGEALWVMPGVGDGTFGTAWVKRFPFRLGYRLVTGDIDADGDLDVIAGRPSDQGDGLYVLQNDGTGHHNLRQSFHTSYDEQFRLADMDEDGLIDLLGLQADRDGAILKVHANRNGTFTETGGPALSVLVNGQASSEEYMHLRVADLDGDRLPDICVSGAFPAHVANPAVYFNRTQLSADGVASPGQRLELTLREPQAAGQPYFLLVSKFGTQPGLQLGSDLLPLNSDPILWMHSMAGSGVFSGFAGVLDGEGRGHATLALPPGYSLPGPIPLDFAFVTFDARLPGVLHASNELGRPAR